MADPSDRLYRTETVPEDFDFNQRVVEVFDDMLDRSIPFYRQVILAAAELLDAYLETGDTVIDLGCATGTPLLEIARRLEAKRLRLIGLDSSPAMLEKARLKAELYGKAEAISFGREDITQLQRSGTGAFILNYTMQFIRPLDRQELAARLFAALKPGGLLILSEKTINHDRRLNRCFIEIYHRYKRERGYSELEIARKREALENILIPFSIEENRKLLTEAGFTGITTFFQWFNFVSLVAFKPR